MLCAALLTGSACRQITPEAPVTPSVTAVPSSAEMGTPVEVTYRYTTTPDFELIRQNLGIYSRFYDETKVLRFLDDHDPVILTSQWLPGTTYTYKRIVMVPQKIPQGLYTIAIRPYKESGKGFLFEMNAPKFNERYYTAGKLLITPRSEDSIRYLSGWFERETEPGDNSYEWRWIGKEAVAELKNPRGDASLYIRYDTDISRFGSPQTFSVYAGDRLIDEIEITSAQIQMKKYDFSHQELGDNPLTVRLTAQQSFQPEGDTRSLAIRIYCLALQPAK